MNTENISQNGGDERKVNFNTAPDDELVAVPGVGPAIARRIVAERPFNGFAELERVPGIGPNLLERMKPYVTLADQSAETRTYEIPATAEPLMEAVIAEEDEPLEAERTDEPVLAVKEDDFEADDTSPEDKREAPELDPDTILVEEVSTEPQDAWATERYDEVEHVVDRGPEADQEPVAARPKTLKRAEAFWLAIGTSLLTFILALVVSLGVIAAINNNQLRFATPGQVTALKGQVEGLLAQADTLQGDLEGLRVRMDGLEPLSGRVEAVESTTSQLESGMAGLEVDMANAAAEVTELRGKTEVVAEQVAALEGESERFQSFFSGLQDLMSQVFPAETAP
jgi:competence protein ComEA